MTGLAIRPESARIVRDYLRAKDAQVPHLFSKVFSEQGRFASTYDIPSPFPATGPQEGREAVTQLFRQMGQACENIITVVPVESLHESGHTLTSRWIVAMTMRGREQGFVGWGTYRWTLTNDGTRADDLAVRFQGMSPLSDATAPALLDKFSDLPHPWCHRSDIQKALSDLDFLDGLQAWLAE